MSGLEAVGVVSSIIQIADLGARVALKLSTFSHKVKQAESNIQNLSKDVSLACTVLRQLGDNLKQDDQIQLYSRTAFETAQKISDECGRVFRSIESAMDSDLSTFAAAAAESVEEANKKSKPFLKFYREMNVIFKEPQLDILQANLERLKNTMLLMLNVIIYAGQLRKKETQNSRDQRELIEVLVQQKHESDQKFKQLTRPIDGAKLENISVSEKNQVTINTAGVFNNMPTINSSTNNDSDSPTLSTRFAELTYLPKLTNDQFSVISLEIEKYSGLIEDILEKLQTAESHLAANRHRRIKQTILNAHARELQAFTTEYGVKAGQLCAQFCQGPLFDKIESQTLQQIWEKQFLAAEARGEGVRKKKRGARSQEAEPEKYQSEEDTPSSGEERAKVFISHLDPNRPDLETGIKLEPQDILFRRRASAHTLGSHDTPRPVRVPLSAQRRRSMFSSEPIKPANTMDRVGKFVFDNRTRPRDDLVAGLLSRWTTLTANEFMA